MALSAALKRLGGTIGAAHLARARALREAVWAHAPVERIPVLLWNARPPDRPSCPRRETVDSPEKMLLNEWMSVSMNLSPAMCREFRRPYHERLSAPFGGGHIHYCGRRLPSQDDRLSTRRLRGSEMGFDNPARNPGYRLEGIWTRAAGMRRTILWLYGGLPGGRPPLAAGLVYGFRNTGVPWVDIGKRRKRAAGFRRD